MLIHRQYNLLILVKITNLVTLSNIIISNKKHSNSIFILNIIDVCLQFFFVVVLVFLTISNFLAAMNLLWNLIIYLLEDKVIKEIIILLDLFYKNFKHIQIYYGEKWQHLFMVCCLWLNARNLIN